MGARGASSRKARDRDRSGKPPRCLRGADDLAVWDHAQSQQAVVVTENAVDFVPLAEHSDDHWGLLLIYRENDRERDMTAAVIARAIGRVDRAYPDGVRGQILVLNAH